MGEENVEGGVCFFSDRSLGKVTDPVALLPETATLSPPVKLRSPFITEYEATCHDVPNHADPRTGDPRPSPLVAASGCKHSLLTHPGLTVRAPGGPLFSLAEDIPAEFSLATALFPPPPAPAARGGRRDRCSKPGQRGRSSALRCKRRGAHG
jgi:hypothetical protein